MDSNKHFVRLENRKKLLLDGVCDVISFDDMSVTLDTVMGRLDVNGNELHIQVLSLDSGEVIINGNISELIYEDINDSPKRGLFGRLAK